MRFALFLEGYSQIEVQERIGGITLYGLTKEREGLIVPAGLVCDAAKELQGSGVIGIDGQYLAEDRLRFG